LESPNPYLFLPHHRMRPAAQFRIIRFFAQEPMMSRPLLLAVLVALAGCSGMPPAQQSSSPCATSPGGYECQVEMYSKAY